MKPIRLKRPPCEVRVERGILEKAGALLSPPDGGHRRFLWLCALPDAAPAPSALLPALSRAGHTVVRMPKDEISLSPADVDAILAVGDTEALAAALRLAEERFPALPAALVPTAFRAQLDFPVSACVGAVLCDPSLPVSEADEKRGVVELIRYAVGFDCTLFDLLYTDFDRGALIRRCLAVRRDLLDAGKTDLLDRLGAPFGDALRVLLSDGGTDADFDSADALATGLAAATRYALKRGICRRDFLSDLIGLLTYHGLPHSALVSDEAFVASLCRRLPPDGDRVLSLPRRLGECGLYEVDPAELVGLLPS